jgi:glycosyltransferase involved in cell wall biosynthesis
VTIAGVGVVVPAHDEARLLPACLAAIGTAATRARSHHDLAVDVVVVLDRCTDASADVVRGHPWARGVEVVAGNVGTARSVGCRAVLERHRPAPASTLWLATTDADSRVPPDWLLRHLQLAAAGAEVVLGTVDVDDWSGHPPHVPSGWRQAYSPGDGHRHVHGANLGIRADVYLAVGGFGAHHRDEDVALAAAAAHRRVARTAAIPVLTSSRGRGRAAGGFADHLASLA